MSILTDLIALLKASTTLKVYAGIVPESSTLPAVALQNIAFSSDRVLEGIKTKRWSQWRAVVVALPSDLQEAIEQLELLDNTSNQCFRNIFVDLSLIETKDPIQPHQRAFVDIRVYKR